MNSMYSKRKKKEATEDEKVDSKDGDKKDDKSNTKKKTDDDDEEKKSSAQLRLQSDFVDLEIPSTIKHKKGSTWDEFSFLVYPDSGYWKGGLFEFQFKIPSSYPFKEPKVLCVDKIYHPNIDYSGNVCVNVLRPWKSTYTVQHVLFALLFLFNDPNPNDVLEKDPADVLRKDPSQFAKNVLSAMRGNTVNGVDFTKNKGTGFK